MKVVNGEKPPVASSSRSHRARMEILMEGQFCGAGEQFLAFRPRHHQVDQFAAVRGDEIGFFHQCSPIFNR